MSHPRQLLLILPRVLCKGYGLRDNNVTLVMNWNTVPSTGLLTLHHGYSSRQMHQFNVPETYAS